MTILSFKGVCDNKGIYEIIRDRRLNKFIFGFKEKYINKKLNKEFYQRLIPKMDNIELLKNLY